MEENTTTIEKVCFTITGEGLTRIARDFVVEKNWREALALLTENLRPDFTHEMAVDVLSGKKKLIGDSSVGLDLEKDGDKATKEYLELVRFQNAGTVRLRSHDMYMRPYAKVTSWQAADLGGGPAGTANRWHRGPKRTYAPGSNCPGTDPIWRSLFYMDDPTNDRAELLKVGKDHQVVLWQQVAMPPIWMQTHKEFQPALNEWLQVKGHALNVRGGCEEGWSDIYETREEALARLEEAGEKAVAEGKPKKFSTGNDLLDMYLEDPEAAIAEGTKQTNLALEGPAPEVLFSEKYNGWLSPAGKFHPCKYGLHNSTAAKIAKTSANAEYNLESRGWAKLTKGSWVWTKSLTSKQIGEIRGWFTDQGKKVPKRVEKWLADDEGRL